MEPTERWTVPVGEGATSALADRPAQPYGNRVVVLGHGASTNMEHRTMQNLAKALLAAGLHVVRYNFLYTEQKRSPPDRIPRLMECCKAVADKVRQELRPEHLILGGHSMGGRAASHLAAEGYACDGLLLLAYPLHPAGQPEKLRSEHLPSIRVPVLCLNGTRDDLCLPERMEPVLKTLGANWTTHRLAGADHSYHVQKRSGRTEADVLEEITEVTRRWIERVSG